MTDTSVIRPLRWSFWWRTYPSYGTQRVKEYCIKGNFCQELIFIAFFKPISWLNLIPHWLFSQNQQCGPQIFLKKNEKQKSGDRTTEEQASDKWCLTKINSWPTAGWSLWRNFLLTKISWYTVVYRQAGELWACLLSPALHPTTKTVLVGILQFDPVSLFSCRLHWKLLE